MHDQPTDAADLHAPDLLHELTQLRSMHSELREELASVRRQRDEAISQSQWLITRVTNAEKAIERLQSEVLVERAKRSLILGHPNEAEVEAVPVAEEPADLVVVVDTPPLEPLDEAVGETVGEAVGEAVASEFDSSDGEVAVERHSADGAEVSDDVVPVAATTVQVPRQASPGSWAGHAGPWLPPEEPAEGSLAHEFAALTERALAVEAASTEEAAEIVPVAVASMDVLPEASEPKKSSLLRRRR